MKMPSGIKKHNHMTKRTQQIVSNAG